MNGAAVHAPVPPNVVPLAPALGPSLEEDREGDGLAGTQLMMVRDCVRGADDATGNWKVALFGRNASGR
jgi:hypothetical protein